MPVPESFKKKYSLGGEQYPAQNADRAIQDLFACITRLHAEVEAANARAADSEKKAADAAAAAEDLRTANAGLNDELSTLKASNARLTAEAERLDKKLADICVTVSANDKKLAESYERLCSMTEKAEKLCDEISNRSARMCREIDLRINELGNAAHVTKAENDIPPVDVTPVPVESAAAQDTATDATEIEELPDDALSIDDTENDPNLFDDSEKQADDAVDANSENMINALRQAIESSKNETKPSDNKDKSAPDEPTATGTSSSMSDAEIKDMLAAMYSDSAGDDSGNADEPQDDRSEKAETEAAEKPAETKSGFGNMKNSLDAIRRRLGK